MNRSASPVPQELMDELRRANERFHDAKVALERAMNGSEYRHVERLGPVEAELRGAEAEIERVEAAILAVLSSAGEEASEPG